ncbi:MAG: HIT domain-containing protein [Allorhizobium sp.]
MTKKTDGRTLLDTFTLDDRLLRDSQLLIRLGLCELRLMRDSRWPWLVLVPQRVGVSEIFDLTPLDQAMLTFEQNTVAAALKNITGATKINVGALGNIVRQLHVHIIARVEGDPSWPGPVWGYQTAIPYAADQQDAFTQKLLEALES